MMINGKNEFYEGHLWVTSPKDIPEEGIQYAIVEFGSMWIPGDERSRTNPGHGYPARSEQKIDLILFENRTVWEKEICDRAERRNDYKQWFPMTFRKAKITTTVNVKVEDL